jgi:hypothetical protein
MDQIRIRTGHGLLSGVGDTCVVLVGAHDRCAGAGGDDTEGRKEITSAARVCPRDRDVRHAHYLVAGACQQRAGRWHDLGVVMSWRGRCDQGFIASRVRGPGVRRRALSIVLRHQQLTDLAQRVNLDAIVEIEKSGLNTPDERTMFVQSTNTARTVSATGSRGRR